MTMTNTTDMRDATTRTRIPDPRSVITKVATNDRTRTIIAGGTLAASAIGAAEIAMTAAMNPVAGTGLAILAITGLGSIRELKHRHRDWSVGGFGPKIGAHREVANAVRIAMAMKIARDPGMMLQSDVAHALLSINSRREDLGEYIGRRGVRQGIGVDFMLRMQAEVLESVKILEDFPADARIGVTRMERFLHRILEPYTALLHARHAPRTRGTKADPIGLTPQTLNALRSQNGFAESGMETMEEPDRIRSGHDQTPRSWHDMAEDLLVHHAPARPMIEEMTGLIGTLGMQGVDMLGDADGERFRILVHEQLPGMAASYGRALALASVDPEEVRDRGMKGLVPALHALREIRDACASRAMGRLETRIRYMEASHPVTPEELDPHGPYGP